MCPDLAPLASLFQERNSLWFKPIISCYSRNRQHMKINFFLHERCGRETHSYLVELYNRLWMKMLTQLCIQLCIFHGSICKVTWLNHQGHLKSFPRLKSAMLTNHELSFKQLSFGRDVSWRLTSTLPHKLFLVKTKLLWDIQLLCR